MTTDPSPANNDRDMQGGQPNIKLLPEIENDDLIMKKTSSDHQNNTDKPTIKSLGGATPQGLKSILSPKARFQDRRRQEMNFQAMMESASQFTKTLEVGSPKNFRIKSRASIIKENSSPGGHNTSWHSNNDEGLDDQKSQSHQPYNNSSKKEKLHTESSDKMQSKSDRTVLPVPLGSNKSIKSIPDSKKSFSALPSQKNPSMRKDPSLDSQISAVAIGGVEAFVRIVMPSEINRKIADIYDSLADTLVSKFINRLSKELGDFHKAAPDLKTLIKNRHVQVEDREIKEFVLWSEIFSAYLEPNRKIKLVTNDKYC